MEKMVLMAISCVTAIAFLSQIFMQYCVKSAEASDYGALFIAYIVFMGFLLMGFK